MVSKIYARLKTGSISNVVVYGSSRLPPSPYVVIKPMVDSLGRGTIYKIFVHMDPGNQLELIEYTRNELYNLLHNFSATTDSGNYKKIKVLEGDVEYPAPASDDGTISMSRSFLSPSHDVF
jgi:hypothetical protein